MCPICNKDHVPHVSVDLDRSVFVISCRRKTVEFKMSDKDVATAKKFFEKQHGTLTKPKTVT